MVAYSRLRGGEDDLLDVDRSFVYSCTCIWRVCDAVNEHLPVEFPIDDVEKLKVLEAEFRAASRGGI